MQFEGGLSQTNFVIYYIFGNVCNVFFKTELIKNENDFKIPVRVLSIFVF